MKSTRKKFWFGYALILFSIILLPVYTILIEVFEASNDNWEHLKETVLQDYVINSLILTLGVSFGSLLLGIPTAWLTSVCSFPLKKTIVLLLILPMAMPSYIIAYTYTGIFDFAGPVQSSIRDYMGWGMEITFSRRFVQLVALSLCFHLFCTHTFTCWPELLF